MTQAISVYISKATFRPAMSLNVEQLKYMTDVKPLYFTIWNKTTTTQNIWCQSFVPTYSGEPVVNLILYMKAVYRSVLRGILTKYITLQL